MRGRDDPLGRPWTSGAARPYLLLILAVLVAACSHANEAFDPTAATLDELMFHAARYGTTEAKREMKAIAKEEMKKRGGEALAYLVKHSHLENIWFRVYAREMVDHLEADEAVPVLLEAVESSNTEVRKNAIFFLGFYRTPEHAVEILPLLEDDELAGATIRTLGKWRVNVATMLIVPFLQDKAERKRVVAANALRDIGDVRAVPYLIHTLNDRYFTVREVSARALSEMGPKAEKAMIRALPRAKPSVKRQLIRTLGNMRSQKAIKPLRHLLVHEDWGVRGDAARALRAISPIEARKWLRELINDEHPFVRTAITL